MVFCCLRFSGNKIKRVSTVNTMREIKYLSLNTISNASIHLPNSQYKGLNMPMPFDTAAIVMFVITYFFPFVLFSLAERDRTHP